MNIINNIDLSEYFTIETDGEYTILHFKKTANKLIIYDPGLYHTAVCKSEVCRIDPLDGKLYYRGISVEDRVEEDFLDVAYHIIFGPDNEKRSHFKNSVYCYFRLLPEQKAVLDAVPSSTHPMDRLGMATIALGGIEKQYLSNPTDPIEKAAFVIAQTAISVSYIYTKIQNQPWYGQQGILPYGELILTQMHGEKDPHRTKKLGKILNTIMILHAEHGLNCSAATVRNVASARGSLYAGIASGMAAFNGIIHGGASQLVSEMYEELLKSGLDVDRYVDEKIARKELLMGFGQRTYNRIHGCWDPRVETMYKILSDPAFDFPEVKEYKNAAIKLIKRIENDEFFTARNLTPNPDLFNCIFYKLFGVPKEMNTVMLALGRIVGWLSNFHEHAADRYPLTRPCDLDKK